MKESKNSLSSSNKTRLINLILQTNLVSIITNADRLPKDRVKMISQNDLFMELICLSESELINIAKELNININ